LLAFDHEPRAFDHRFQSSVVKAEPSHHRLLTFDHERRAFDHKCEQTVVRLPAFDHEGEKTVVRSQP